MNHKCFIVTIFFVWNSIIIFNHAYSQQLLDNANYRFYYELIWQFDTIKKKQTRDDLIILQVGQNTSKSYSYHTFQVDSLRGTPDGEEVRRTFVRRAIQESITSGGRPKMTYYRRMSTIVYKNFPQGQMTITDIINEDYYEYSDELNIQNWQIVDSTKNVLDYPCQMAVTDFRGRSWIAWFASDIPIGDGPWKFSGLPGLIMKVYDTENHYHFTLVGINQVENDPIVFSPVVLSFEAFGKYEKTSRIEFLKGLNWYLNNQAVVLNAQLGINAFDESLQGPRLYDFMERDYK
ncbi:MAG: GLPGLI family protein [Bacteroidota bacterium]